MSVRQRERELRQIVRRISDNFDIIHTASGHYKIILYGPLGKRFVIASGSASDHRANKNLIADLAREYLSLHPIASIGTQPQPEIEDAIVSKKLVRRRR
jgi:hypothetical protein